MLNWRIKILKSISNQNIFHFKQIYEKVDKKFDNFSEKDLAILNITNKEKEIIKKLGKIQTWALDFLKPKAFGEFKVFQKWEIRYFESEGNNIIEISTLKPLLLDIFNYIKNIDFWFISNKEFKEKTEEIITLDMLKNNKEKLENIFIKNAILNEENNEDYVLRQKIEIFLNEKNKINYNIKNLVLENYKKIFTHFYWYFTIFYQNYFLKKWNNLYPIKIYFSYENSKIINKWYEIIWTHITINKLFDLINIKNWIIYKEDKYIWKKDFYKIKDILKWL